MNTLLLILPILYITRIFNQKLNTFCNRLSLPVYSYSIPQSYHFPDIKVNEVNKNEISSYKYITGQECIFIQNKVLWLRNFYLHGSVVFNTNQTRITLSLPLIELLFQILLILFIFSSLTIFTESTSHANIIFLILIIGLDVYNFMEQVKIQKKIVGNIIATAINAEK